MDLDFFKKILKGEEERISKEIKSYESEDPYKDTNRSSEVLDDTITEIEGHDRILAVVGNLQQDLSSVKEALKRIENGSYGVCVSCQKKIEFERLKIMPTALLCASCQDNKKRS